MSLILAILRNEGLWISRHLSHCENASKKKRVENVKTPALRQAILSY